ncbi:MAG: serine hydroxymethyltransferase [Minisyncoccia bacterium]
MSKLLTLLKQHENWRKECINLIASENVTSSLCDKVYLSDLKHRYAEGLPGKRYYQGLKYFDQIEILATDFFKEHFKVNFVDLRPISGTLANFAVFSALGKRGDKIITLGLEGGSHISHEKVGAAGILGFEIFHFPFDIQKMNIDLEKAKEMILQIKPKFIILGGSVILFPQPIKELKEVCNKTGTKIIYDAAHVFGLIAAGLFQDPLKEGADILTTSTHKTFPGPQGGIILGNIEEDLQKEIMKNVFPGITSNHHLHRIPAVCIVLSEIKKFGKRYGEQIIKNAKTLAKKLSDYNFNVLGKEQGFTQTHQVLVRVENFGGGEKVAHILEKVNIILNKNVLPGGEINPLHPNGIRIGVQEMTRFGMKEKEMEKIADFIKKAIENHLPENLEKIKKEVIDLRKKFQEIKYCFKET